MYSKSESASQEGQVAVETRPGRSLKIESLLRSLGVVMLKGKPDQATMKGLSEVLRKTKRAGQEEPITLVEGRASVVFTDVVRIRRKLETPEVSLFA